MRTLGLALFLFVPAELALAQLDSDTIAITSSRTAYIQPDQAVIGVAVSSMSPVGLDDVLAALQSSGITASNLSGTSGFSWSFTLPAAFSQLQQKLAALGDLQQSVKQKNPGLGLTFAIVGSQVSAALQSQSCATSDLLADAAAQAQKLANVAGLKLGPVMSLANLPIPVSAQIIPAYRLGDFLVGATGIVTTTFGTAPANPVYCSVTVKFKLLR